ncbi:MAG: N-acetylmuramoyl-L-alanine amidase family protein, partial [Ruminococcus sp.]
MAYRIVVDSGHGGEDPGAVYQGRQEKDDTLQLGLAVGEILKENGVDVIFTRTEDIYQTPFQKAQIANEAMADYFVSIHRNSSPRPNQYEGVETLVYDKSGIKLEMAENINSALEDVGFKNLGVKARPGLVVLRRTKMPALLVEAGFINSDSDNQLFDEKFNEIAQAIAGGILGTLAEETVEEPVLYRVQ